MGSERTHIIKIFELEFNLPCTSQRCAHFYSTISMFIYDHLFVHFLSFSWKSSTIEQVQNRGKRVIALKTIGRSFVLALGFGCVTDFLEFMLSVSISLALVCLVLVSLISGFSFEDKADKRELRCIIESFSDHVLLFLHLNCY